MDVQVYKNGELLGHYPINAAASKYHIPASDLRRELAHAPHRYHAESGHVFVCTNFPRYW